MRLAIVPLSQRIVECTRYPVNTGVGGDRKRRPEERKDQWENCPIK